MEYKSQHKYRCFSPVFTASHHFPDQSLDCDKQMTKKSSKKSILLGFFQQQPRNNPTPGMAYFLYFNAPLGASFQAHAAIPLTIGLIAKPHA